MQPAPSGAVPSPPAELILRWSFTRRRSAASIEPGCDARGGIGNDHLVAHVVLRDDGRGDLIAWVESDGARVSTIESRAIAWSACEFDGPTGRCRAWIVTTEPRGGGCATPSSHAPALVDLLACEEELEYVRSVLPEEFGLAGGTFELEGAELPAWRGSRP